jgi:hypothetical protein
LTVRWGLLSCSSIPLVWGREVEGDGDGKRRWIQMEVGPTRESSCCRGSKRKTTGGNSTVVVWQLFKVGVELVFGSLWQDEIGQRR